MRSLRRFFLCSIAISFCAVPTLAQTSTTEIKLLVPAGTPLRLELSERLRLKHEGEPLRAFLTNSIYAFDKPVIPAGTEVLGKISRIDPVSRKKRIAAMADGDFTPSRSYGVIFDMLVLPDGKRRQIGTDVSPGISDVIHLVSGAEREKKKGVASKAAARAKKKVSEAMRTARTTIKSPGRFARLKRYLASQLPIRRQFLEPGTQFNAALKTDLDFGVSSGATDDVALLGNPLADSSVLRAWLTAEISSATAAQGAPVEAIVSEPLFSSDQKLLVPANSRLIGEVLQTKRAGKLHHNGLLRIALHRLEFPDGTMQSVRTNLESVDVDRAAGVKLDAEGGAEATDGRGRYVSTGASIAIAVMLAAPDNLAPGEAAVKDPDVRTAGGVSALRLAGAVAGFAIRTRGVSIALGSYGAATSIYSNFLSKGRDVTFPKGTPVEIGFEPNQTTYVTASRE